MVAGRGLELVLVAATALAAVVLDALALALRMAGLAGVALASLWAPTLVFERPPSTLSLMLGAAVWLVLLWLTRTTRGPDAGLRREAPLAAAITTAVTLAAVLLGPLATALPGYGTVRLPATWGDGIGGTSRLSLSDDLDLRASLNGQAGSLVLQYTSDVADVGPLRTATLMGFDGQHWEPGPPRATSSRSTASCGRTVGTRADGTVWTSCSSGSTSPAFRYPRPARHLGGRGVALRPRPRRGDRQRQPGSDLPRVHRPAGSQRRCAARRPRRDGRRRGPALQVPETPFAAGSPTSPARSRATPPPRTTRRWRCRATSAARTSRTRPTCPPRRPTTRCGTSSTHARATASSTPRPWS